MASFEANVANRFPAGSKLSVVPRLGSAVPAASDAAVKTVTSDKRGDVSVKGLPEGPYWLTDGETSVAFTLKDAESSTHRLLREAEALRQRMAQADLAKKNPELLSAAPGRTTTPNTIVGARGSQEAKNRKVEDPAPQPFVNQLDVEGIPQRSDTPFGEAHPISKAELAMERDPEKEREKLEGKPMRSDTEFGAQPVIPKEELKAEQALAKDDGELEGVDPKPKGAKLASDTELGSKPPADVSAEKPAEDSAPVEKPAVVPGEGVRDQKRKK